MTGSSEFSAIAGTFAIGGDLVVNRLGFGTFRLTGPGGWGVPANPHESVRILRRAVELGVNFIDTADSYGPMVAEQSIRRALHPYPAGLVIATKVGQARPGPGEWVPLGRPEYLRQQTELSLRNLGLERIDLLLLHRIDPKVSLADQVGTLRSLQEQGKVRHIGLSEVSIMDVAEAGKIAPIVCVQNLFNVVDRSAEPLLEYTAQRAMGFIPWHPLAAGSLAVNHRPQLALPGTAGASPAQIALAWLLKRSPNILPIPGTSSLAHLEENMRAAQLQFLDADFEVIARLGASE